MSLSTISKVLGRLQLKLKRAGPGSSELSVDNSSGLPFDLWVIIAACLSNCDLSTLGQASVCLNDMLRPVLYHRPVHLSPRCENTKSTLHLITSNLSVAQAITHLHLSSSIFFPITVLLDALHKLTCLKFFWLDFQIFPEQKDIIRVFDTLRKRTPPIEALKLDGYPRLEDVDTAALDLSGLKSVNWTERLANRHMWSCIRTSADTLERVSTPLSRASANYPELPLWNMRFPRLRTLELSEYPFHSIDEPGPDNLFIKAHGETLREVNARYYVDYYDPCSVSFETFTGDTAPPSKVRRFKGAVSCFIWLSSRSPHLLAGGALIQLELSSLGTHGRAAISSIDPWIQSSIDSNANHNFFLNLQDLAINIHPAMNYPWTGVKADEIITLIKHVAKLCGSSLESWSRSLPPIRIKSAQLCEAFQDFPKLKTLHLCQKIFGEGPADNYVLKLAKSCPSLEVINIEEEEIFEGSIIALAVHIGRDPTNSDKPVFIERKCWRSFAMWDEQPAHTYL
jgi:hypothetical protein